MSQHRYCAICRRTVDMASRHVEIGAKTVGEDARKEEAYLFHLDCWTSLTEGWGQPA